KLSYSDYEHLSETEIVHMVNQLVEKIHSINQNFEELTKQVKLLNDKKLVESERILSIEQKLNIDAESLKKVIAELDACLTQSSFSDLEHVQRILDKSFDVPAAKKQLLNYNQQVFSLREQLKQINALLGEQTFDPSQFQELEEELIKLKNEQDEINESLVREQTILANSKRDFERKVKLDRQQETVKLRAANINILKQFFKSSGFVSYISTVYLQNLCEVANKRFYKLTRQQLRLEVTDKNDFQVRDFLNNGKVRNVKTLSGGQTFQASLSLALALAESVQQQNKSNQNFFFLDEGFGSLDKESLQIAFETLKSLRKENRIVGIISHVEELQQEIDVFLTIVNDPFTGSKITGNWE